MKHCSNKRSGVSELVSNYELEGASEAAQHYTARQIEQIAVYYIDEDRTADAKKCLCVALMLQDDSRLQALLAYLYALDEEWYPLSLALKELDDEAHATLYAKFASLHYELHMSHRKDSKKLAKQVGALMAQIDNVYDWAVDLALLLLDTPLSTMVMPLLEGAYALNRGSKMIASMLLEVYYDQRMYGEALAVGQKLVINDSYDAESWMQLGDVQMNLHLYHDALKSYEFALTIDPKQQKCRLLCADARRNTGDIDGAKRQLEKFVKTYGQGADSTYILGLCERDLGNYPAAKELLEKTQQMDTSFVHVLVELAEVARLMGNETKALAYVEKAIANGEDTDVAWGMKGEIYMIKEDYQEAEVALKRAMEINPENEQIRCNLAYSLYMRHKYDAAANYYATVTDHRVLGVRHYCLAVASAYNAARVEEAARLVAKYSHYDTDLTFKVQQIVPEVKKDKKFQKLVDEACARLPRKF